MTHTAIRSLLASLAFALTATLAPAQVKEPPRAEKLDIQVRYRIRADRDERIRQYRILEKHLASLGFVDARKDDPDHDLDILDPNAERFTGTIPGAKVLDVLKDVRVQNILFAPNGFTYPDAPEKPVAVKFGLRTGYPLNVQQQLHRQLVAHLGRLGFREALGYDTQGYALIRGAIQYKSLDLLVKDIRFEPSGWFLAAVPLDQLPAPLRDGNPIRWAEVLPITDFPAPYSPPPVLPAQLKYTADLRAALLDPATKDSPPRVEVMFNDRITDVETLRSRVTRYVGSSLDGVIGNIASIRFPRVDYIERFSQEPDVMGIRLPRQGAETIALAADGKGLSPADAIKAARLDELHKRGYTGAGVKVVLIGSDFSGAEKLIQDGQLPKRTRIVDLTVELSPDLAPAKVDPARVGTGTAAAKVLAATAPDCDLVLVRIDPGCFFHLNTIIRLSRGELAYTDALLIRLDEISNRSRAFDREQRAAIDAYRTAFADLSDNEIAVGLRKKAKADLDAVVAKEKALTAHISRFNAYQKEITTALLGAEVFVNTLVWESGYPLDALSEFDGTLDKLAAPLPPRVVKRAGDPLAAPRQPLVWVQSASAAGASVWGGPFLDANRDGLLEFVQPGTKLPADNWSPQLNFLGMSAQAGPAAPDIAAGTKLRFVVQWREPADPNFPESDIPLYPLTLRLLRQIDPTGEKRSSDEMLDEARSVSVPTVIYRTGTFLVFEQMLEYTVPAAGRYALAIESPQLAAPALPGLRREVEIYPRVVVETLGTAVSEARAVFRSYTSFTAGVGTPADALGAITIGTEGTNVQVGGGTGLTLRGKPDVLGPSGLAFGNQAYRGQGVATAFAGGAAVVLVQARAARPNVFFSARIEPGKKLELPADWLRLIPQVPRAKP